MLIKIADKSPGTGLQSMNKKSPVYAVGTQRMTESLNKLKQERLRKSSFFISLQMFKTIQIIMVLQKVLLILCLLMCLVPEPAFSLMEDQHRVEVGGISISRTSTSNSIRHLFLLCTSDDNFLTNTVPKVSSSSIGMPF